ncbi:hypothetical protein BUALT_Bualt07G0104400 [Buddleja alternifolia]|uniref:Uncharacterized protein n=1 Tax=Buddleja alternifolia TaxID=168488 RepID=A0AAV6XG84_9LAMI|nr:hypothetical protein BUALT_Bualt07G0104400 [Buddleja alternifolia]
MRSSKEKKVVVFLAAQQTVIQQVMIVVGLYLEYRKSNDGSSADRLFEILANFIVRTNAILDDMVKKIGWHEHDASEKRKGVYGALEKIPGLDMSQRLWIATKLVKNDLQIDMFFSLPDEARPEMVRLILAGSI